MPNFSSFFSRTPKVVAPQVSEKVTNTRTVGQTMGEAFKFGPAVGVNKAFSKRMLKWCAKEFSPENALFLIMCDKFKIDVNCTTEEFFLTIYNDFVATTAPMQVNLKDANSAPLKGIYTRIRAPRGADDIPPPPPYPDTFNNAVWEIEKLLDTDTGRRLKAQSWTTAFEFSNDAAGVTARQSYNDGIAYLQRHGITLQGNG